MIYRVLSQTLETSYLFRELIGNSFGNSFVTSIIQAIPSAGPTKEMPLPALSGGCNTQLQAIYGNMTPWLFHQDI